MEIIQYSATEGVVQWHGCLFENNQEYTDFLQNDVAGRVYDQEWRVAFETHLRGLASTGFEQNNLNEILSAYVPEERDWAVGEALAEAWLIKKHHAIFPWNLERDKRTPKASLPGADLVGFIKIQNEIHLLIGEVKSSSEQKTPPQVMTGKTGMIHQLEGIVSNLSLVSQLLFWLHPRCKDTVYEPDFNNAVSLLFKSNNKTIAIFGILIRDTSPSENDLKNRAKAFAKIVQTPTFCQLKAIYLPHAISDLPSLISMGVQP